MADNITSVLIGATAGSITTAIGWIITHYLKNYRLKAGRIVRD
jgi:hypothetical protein